ncbi:hypothetical protein D3C79_1013580 [compost metagenome]
MADGAAGVFKAKAPGIALVHPDDARITVDDDRAFAGLLDDFEQRTNRQQAHLLVVLEAVTVLHAPLRRR